MPSRGLRRGHDLVSVEVRVHALFALAAFASRMARQTFSRVNGMSMWSMPSGASASITALTNAAGEPTFGLSPTPFAPIGWCGLGVHGVARLPVRRLERRWDEILGEVGVEVVAALVVADLLHEGYREALGEAAVNLPFDDHRIDDRAAVVDRHEATDVASRRYPRSTSTTATYAPLGNVRLGGS